MDMNELTERIWALNPNNPNRPQGVNDEDRRQALNEAMRAMTGGDAPDLDAEAFQEMLANMAAEPMGPSDGSNGHVPAFEPALTTMTPAEIRQERTKRASSIFKTFDMLKGIVERHESTIQKRWKKKTKEQKRKILLSAWKTGDMPKMHRPDFDAFRKQVDSKGQAGHRYRTSFIWPFINQEDLVKPRTLLLLMNSRGRNSPSQFAAADLEAIHLGVVGHAIQRVFLNEHVMLFTGRDTAETYGELLNWDDDPNAFDWLMNRKHMQPGEGLLILESQDKTMEFLVDCAKAILHDIEEDALLTSPVQPEPAASELETAEAPSWALLAAEAPYRLPSRLNFASIESLLKAKRDAVEDHIWSMREDPAYFAGVMQESWEHRQEHIKDRNDEVHPLFLTGHQDLLWGRVISNEVTVAFIQLEFWSEFHRQAAHLKDLQEKHAVNIKPEDDLPSEYLDAILMFRKHIDAFKKGPIGQLKVSLMASPPCRHLFVREPQGDYRSIENIVSQKSTSSFDKLQFDFFWLFRVLWDDDDKLYQLRFPNVLDELERMIEAEPKIKQLVSPYVASQISDLSIIAECLRQLDSYQPWANMFEDKLVERSEDIEKKIDLIQRPWGRLLSATSGSETAIARHGSPTDNRFYYPISKKRNHENVDAMRQAEQNLDTFWHKVDELINRNAGNLTGTSTRQLMLQPRSLERTPEWEEPQKAGAAKDQTIDRLTKPLSEVYFDLERRTERTTDKDPVSRQPKSKQKTRGEPSTNGATEPVAQEDPTPRPDTLPNFAVDARSLKVFRTLFYTPSTSSTPGEVKWDDFLWAMASVSFRPEKLYGSVWQFTPTMLDVETPIQFHEPHGSMNNKIPFYVARRHGRRLNRNYGFHGGMFSLAEKQKT